MAKDKARYFTFLLYPESVPDDWQEKLAEIGQPLAISPLHDKDLNADGTLKKPHWHIIYIASNPVTADSVRKRIQRNLGNQSVALVQIIATTVENTFLYFTHETQDAIAKNKALYNAKDIKFLNNFDIDRYIVLDVEDKDDKSIKAHICVLRRFKSILVYLYLLGLFVGISVKNEIVY